MLKIRRPLGRLIFNMGIAIPGKTVSYWDGPQRAVDSPQRANNAKGLIVHTFVINKRNKIQNLRHDGCLDKKLLLGFKRVFEWSYNYLLTLVFAFNNGYIYKKDMWLQLKLMLWVHNSDVIMGTIASQITSLTIIYSTVYSDADQRKHQSSASLAFVREFTGDRWIPDKNGQ